MQSILERLRFAPTIHKLIVLLTALIVVKGLLWIALVPALQTPDEERHFSTVMWRAEPKSINIETTSIELKEDVFDVSTYHIPDEYREFLQTIQFENTRFNQNNHQSFSSSSKLGPNESNFVNSDLDSRFKVLPPTIVSYPPLYYETASWVYSLTRDYSLFDRFYAVRIFTFLLSLGVALCAYKTARVLDFSNIQAGLIAGIVSFQPMISFIYSSVNPDTMLILGLSMFILFSISTIKYGFTSGNLVGLLAASLIAIFTKQPGIMTIPFLIILAVFVFFRGGLRNGLMLGITRIKKNKIILISLAVFIITLFMLIFFQGNLPGLLPLGGISGLFSAPAAFESLPASISAYAERHFQLNEQYELFGSYWGWFGWFEYPMDKYVYAAIGIALTLGLVGFLGFLFSRNGDTPSNKPAYLYLAILVVIFHMSIVYSEFWFFKENRIMFGLQGRYFLPTILSLSLIHIKGLTFLFRKINTTLVLGILLLGMIILNFTALIYYIVPDYYL